MDLVSAQSPFVRPRRNRGFVPTPQPRLSGLSFFIYNEGAFGLSRESGYEKSTHT